MRHDYLDVSEAVTKFPSLKRTVDLARKLNYPLLKHRVDFNKRGTVNCHWFRTKDGFERNQTIFNMLRHIQHQNPEYKFTNQ